jgi:hypothetical protein
MLSALIILVMRVLRVLRVACSWGSWSLARLRFTNTTVARRVGGCCLS